jgi:predicted transcriptional regulator
MSPNARKLLETVETWPEEDQEELLRAAREIEARRRGVYEATPEELVGIDRGLEDSRQGRFATDEELAVVRAKFRRA